MFHRSDSSQCNVRPPESIRSFYQTLQVTREKVGFCAFVFKDSCLSQDLRMETPVDFHKLVKLKLVRVGSLSQRDGVPLVDVIPVEPLLKVVYVPRIYFDISIVDYYACL